MLSSQFANRLESLDRFLPSGKIFMGIVTCAFAVIAVATPVDALAQKYDPEHPEVRAMIDRGVAYMKDKGGGHDGDAIIQALAVLNSYMDYGYERDEFVQRGVQRALKLVSLYREHLDDFDAHNLRNVTANDDELRRMYEPCVALMMLVEFNDEQYESEIRDLIEFIVRRQMPGGGWTYNHVTTGDTSQTQYCCLALWIAHEKGFDVPMERSEKAANFWMGGQSSEGTWAYQIVPGQRSGSPKMSLNAAGAGSLYMLGDIMGVNPPQKAKVATAEGSLELPGFVERLTRTEIDRLKAQEGRNEPETGNIDVAAFNSAKGRSNQWLTSSFDINPDTWPYYALYGYERYASFREKIDGSVSELPDWYDRGIEFLKQTQRGDGSFPQGADESGAATQTALAVLFMVRSTQRLTNLSREAVMRGNRSLAGDLQTRNGRVISVDQKKDLDQLLSDLGNKDMSPEDLQNMADSIREGALTNIKGSSTAQQLTLLREMVTDERPLVRIIAVRALGQARLVDNCPALIYALTDPNPEVVQEASIALQYVSRKADVPAVPQATGKELPDGRIDYNTDTASYKQGIRTLYHYWADWYLELKPNAELFPVDLK